MNAAKADAVLAVVRALGVEPTPWQARFIRHWFAEDPTEGHTCTPTDPCLNTPCPLDEATGGVSVDSEALDPEGGPVPPASVDPAQSRITTARQAYEAARQALDNSLAMACPGPHQPRQHRDMNPPWCSRCLRTIYGDRVTGRRS